MKPSLQLAVLQHHPAEGPGRLRAWARDRGHGLEVLPAWTGMRTLPEADALVLLGGPANLDAAPPWLEQELELLRPWVATGRPLFGICLGAQILAQLLGGQVRQMAAWETGWQPIAFEDGRSLQALQWHEQGMVLPAGWPIRARSPACPVQVFGQGRQRGVQFHPEWDAATVADLHQAFGADCPLPKVLDPVLDAAIAQWFEAELDHWVRA